MNERILIISSALSSSASFLNLAKEEWDCSLFSHWEEAISFQSKEHLYLAALVTDQNAFLEKELFFSREFMHKHPGIPVLVQMDTVNESIQSTIFKAWRHTLYYKVLFHFDLIYSGSLQTAPHAARSPHRPSESKMFFPGSAVPFTEGLRWLLYFITNEHR